MAAKAVAVVQAVAETVQSLKILKEKRNMAVFPSSQSLRVLIELLNTRKLLLLYQSIVQSKDIGLLTILFIRIMNKQKQISKSRTQTQYYSQQSIILRSILLTQLPLQERMDLVLPSNKW